MTNTKFRKKALLSSVAMLLVALIALGSATFAWFVANPTASAKGLVMKTNASPGVVVASATVLALAGNEDTLTNAYKSSTILNATGTFAAPTANAESVRTLEPVAPSITPSSNAISFYTTKAKDSAHSTIADSPSWESAGTSAYYSERIYFKASTLDDNVSGPTIKQASVKITVNEDANDVKSGIKVALVSSQNDLIGIWMAAGGSNQKTYDASTTTKLSAAAYSCTASETLKAIDSSKYIPTSSAINSNGTTDNYITVYVYLDGEESKVFSDNVPRLTQILDEIEVTVSTAAPA